jgi:hypothetical protein
MLKEVRGIRTTIEELKRVASKYDPEAATKEDNIETLFYTVKALSIETAIPFLGIGFTPTYERVLSCWEIYGDRKSTKDKEKKLSSIFGKPIEDVTIDVS